jgi:hypothetical protein
MVGLRKNGQVVANDSAAAGVTAVPLAATNAAGVAAGSYTAFALLGSGPPVFNTPAVDRRVALGTNAFFRMWAIGAQPISYQWNLNGQPIQKETNSWLVVSNVQPASMGFYTVTASNKSGSITSADMGLNVPLIVRLSSLPTNFQFDAQTSPGLTYKVEAKDDLLDSIWQPVKDVVADSGITTITIDALSPAIAHRFYRIRLP